MHVPAFLKFAAAAAALACAPFGVSGCQRARSTADVPSDSTPVELTSVAPAPLGSATTPVGTHPGHAGRGSPLTPSGQDQLAAFAAGCFWGVEDAFRHVPGVVATAAGYSGGHVANPTYEDVCTHTTGHAETVLVEFDPTRVPYEQLLRVFWKIHDPTQGNRQGPDVGDSYRSVVFTFGPEEEAAARSSLQSAQKELKRPITTRIQPMTVFYVAEPFHQQFAERTGSHACPIGSQLGSL